MKKYLLYLMIIIGSCFLLNNSVNAYTVYQDSNVIIDEEYIYNTFLSTYDGFTLDEFPYIDCTKSSIQVYCKADAEELFNNYYLAKHESSYGYYNLRNYEVVSSRVSFTYRINTQKLTLKKQINTTFLDYSGSSSYSGTFYYNNSGNKSYTNFNPSLISGISSDYDSKLNVLDFSKYKTVNYWLNDGSIFEDEEHSDFNKVCWENFDELMFSVSIDSTYDGSYNVNYEDKQDGETYVESGFYVFDDISKLKRGTRAKVLGTFDYDFYATTWLSGVTFDQLNDITNEFYLMDTDEKLQIRYSNIIDSLGNYDISRGDSYYYDNLDKLKNGHYVDFTYYYNVVDDYRYDIFYLNEQKENFCIYIPKQFIVTTLSINELDGFFGEIPIHNNTTDSFVDVSEISGQLHYNTLFSIITQFINSIKDTVNFINGYIYSFFISLPPLCQMFIFTIITLIVIKTIIWMVVK